MVNIGKKDRYIVDKTDFTLARFPVLLHPPGVPFFLLERKTHEKYFPLVSFPFVTSFSFNRFAYSLVAEYIIIENFLTEARAILVAR